MSFSTGIIKFLNKLRCLRGLNPKIVCYSDIITPPPQHRYFELYYTLSLASDISWRTLNETAKTQFGLSNLYLSNHCGLFLKEPKSAIIICRVQINSPVLIEKYTAKYGTSKADFDYLIKIPNLIYPSQYFRVEVNEDALKNLKSETGEVKRVYPSIDVGEIL